MEGLFLASSVWQWLIFRIPLGTISQVSRWTISTVFLEVSRIPENQLLSSSKLTLSPLNLCGVPFVDILSQHAILPHCYSHHHPVP